MANYRPLFVGIWKDSDFQMYHKDKKLIFIYLCSNPATTESGIYPITPKTISDDTGVSVKKVEKYLSEMKNIKYDFDHHTVFIVEFLRYNGRGRPELVEIALASNYLLTIKSPGLWKLFKDRYPLRTGFLPDDLPDTFTNSIQQDQPPDKILPDSKKTKDIELPKWLPEKLWQSFVDYRKEIKKPLKERGMTNAISKLTKFKEAGQDIKAVIEQTTTSTNDWIDLYEVKDNGKGKKDNIGTCPGCQRDHIDLTDQGICLECSRSEGNPGVVDLANSSFKAVEYDS